MKGLLSCLVKKFTLLVIRSLGPHLNMDITSSKSMIFTSRRRVKISFTRGDIHVEVRTQAPNNVYVPNSFLKTCKTNTQLQNKLDYYLSTFGLLRLHLYLTNVLHRQLSRWSSGQDSALWSGRPGFDSLWRRVFVSELGYKFT